ncbi:MAG: NUDIX domain-containing protein [Balneolaceae bacterium]|nr:MAG: NUDIX domain-containing protein [Balneolaceae bacterium]
MGKKKLIDLYLYSYLDRKPVFLLFRRAKGHIYEGQWRMVGGKVKEGEKYWEAAVREMKEETGLNPIRFFTLPSVNQFYEHRTDKILTIPAFAAEVSLHDKIVLNSEHNQYEWFRVEDAVEKVIWPEQQRLLRLTFTIITSEIIPEEWCIPQT